MGSRVDPPNRSLRLRNVTYFAENTKKDQSLRLKRVANILKKRAEDRNAEDKIYLAEDAHLVPLAEKRIKKSAVIKDRNIEREDPNDILEEKCSQLTDYISNSRNLIVYTGAGISTSANIPDYRGPNGVWSQLNRNKEIINVPLQDLVCAEPTFTHLALTELYKRGIVKHLVSQNCDGLHIRSGFPSKSLSEVHGDMYLEICSNCKKLYWRDFDVTEKTSFHRHRTGRFCHLCPREKGSLMDTIVHFGEKSHYDDPYNWIIASEIVRSADLILTLGTSLTVLRRYQCLWPKKQSSSLSTTATTDNNKPKLVIVNLQWTSKDSQAALKINGKCDDVMRIVCDKLSIHVPDYKKSNDPLLSVIVSLKEGEDKSHNRLRLTDLINQDQPESKDQCSQFLSSKASCKPSWFGKGIKGKRR